MSFIIFFRGKVIYLQSLLLRLNQSYFKFTLKTVPYLGMV